MDIWLIITQLSTKITMFHPHLIPCVPRIVAFINNDIEPLIFFLFSKLIGFVWATQVHKKIKAWSLDMYVFAGRRLSFASARWQSPQSLAHRVSSKWKWVADRYFLVFKRRFPCSVEVLLLLILSYARIFEEAIL